MLSNKHTQVTHGFHNALLFFPASNYILLWLRLFLDQQTDRVYDRFHVNNKHVLRVWWSAGVRKQAPGELEKHLWSGLERGERGWFHGLCRANKQKEHITAGLDSLHFFPDQIPVQKLLQAKATVHRHVDWNHPAADHSPTVLFKAL